MVKITLIISLTKTEFNRPLNVQGMAEQDIKMNQFQIVSNASYVYVELADGSQAKIKKSDLVELIRAAMPVATQASKGLMQANGFEQGKYISNEKYNNQISAGVYSSTDNLENMGTGILLVLRGIQYTAHLYITNSGSLYIKTVRSNGEILRDWKLINNT